MSTNFKKLKLKFIWKSWIPRISRHSWKGKNEVLDYQILKLNISYSDHENVILAQEQASGLTGQGWIWKKYLSYVKEVELKINEETRDDVINVAGPINHLTHMEKINFDYIQHRKISCKWIKGLNVKRKTNTFGRKYREIYLWY